jgi:3-hydroxyanthranilate 3,4-dioxygenase
VKDAFEWACAACGSLVVRKELQLQSIVSDLPKVFAEFYETSDAERTCKTCETVHPAKDWRQWHADLAAHHPDAAVPALTGS